MKHLEEGMLLYHGSYCEVVQPNLQKCSKHKDFGQGFYLTPSKEQAKSFAKTSLFKAKARGIAPSSAHFGYVSVYRISAVHELRTFGFETADTDWLHCIVAHRKGDVFSDLISRMKDFDVIFGKIANDNTNATIIAYMNSLYGPVGSGTADSTCISLLLPEKLKDQFCFRTDRALSKLQFLESEKVAVG